MDVYYYDAYTQQRGDPSGNPISFVTGVKPSEPPKKITVARDASEQMFFVVNWYAPCGIDKGPLDYIVSEE